MSVNKVEHWEVGWHAGRRSRSRRFEEERDAQAFARELEGKGRRPSSIRKLDRWQVRWREGGRGSRAHKRTFERKGDAERFEREVKRRKELGELALWGAAEPQRPGARSRVVGEVRRSELGRADPGRL